MIREQLEDFDKQRMVTLFMANALDKGWSIPWVARGCLFILEAVEDITPKCWAERKKS